MSVDNANLAALVGSRICHDLVSPVSSVTNALDLLNDPGDIPTLITKPIGRFVTGSAKTAKINTVVAGISVVESIDHHLIDGKVAEVFIFKTIGLAVMMRIV